ncbi:MAG TPA: hypothetical protein VK480_00520 [Solirubrobacterales bacterium]|nr:hypothetical protein [Solirubrobacterales bacterium]
MSERKGSVPAPEDQVIVLFGATGDLARRKLLPGMFHLAQVGLMPPRFRIVGAARKGIGVEEFRELAGESVVGSSRQSGDAETWERFAESLRFASVGEGFDALEREIAAAREELGPEAGLLFYLSLPLRPADVVRGQYAGYREEEGVAPDSDTETFVAVKAFVDNWRWEGVPFYLRSGKRMAESRHLLTIAYSQPPRRMFPLDCDQIVESFGHDHLTLELGEPGSISASFLAKVPGSGIELGEAHMHFSYADTFGGQEEALDPYERLIHDVMVGDRTFFSSSEAIERLWEISEPLLADPPPAIPYEPGSWGPREADDLIAPRRWHLPSEHV